MSETIDNSYRGHIVASTIYETHAHTNVIDKSNFKKSDMHKEAFKDFKLA